jgi:hypothetical protein
MLREHCAKVPAKPGLLSAALYSHRTPPDTLQPPQQMPEITGGVARKAVRCCQEHLQPGLCSFKHKYTSLPLKVSVEVCWMSPIPAVGLSIAMSYPVALPCLSPICAKSHLT